MTDKWWTAAPLAPAQVPAAADGEWWKAAPLADAAPVSAPQMAPEYDAMGNPTGGMVAAPAPVTMGYGEQMGKIGGLVDKGVRLLANGATFGMADRFAGGMDALTGQAPSYSEGVGAQHAKTEEIRKEAPILSTVIEAAGGLGTGLGLAKNGITLAGRVGPGLLRRGFGFGLEGAGYGAAAGAGNTYSDNPQDFADNAASGARTGLLIGGALPLAGAAASGAFRLAKPIFSRPIDGVGRTGSTLMRVAAQADEPGLRGLVNLGPEAMLPDAGPSMLGLAQGAGTGTGPGRSALVNALRERDAGVGQRLAASVDEALGPAPIPSRVDAGLKTSQRALSPEYEKALEGAKAVDSLPIAERIETLIPDSRGAIRTALESVRSDLNIPGNAAHLDPSPRALLGVRHSIDAINETAPDAVRSALKPIREMVDAELRAKVPGIKATDAQYADLARQRQALERGQTMFDSGRSNAIRPAELADELQAGIQPHGDLVGPSAAPLRLRDGARAEIDRLQGTNVNDLPALERTIATPQDWNAQKIEQLWSPEAYRDLAKAIAGERQMRSTYQNVVQGSQTAQRSASEKAMAGGDGLPLDMTMTGAGANAMRTLAKVMAGRSTQATKDQIGQVLSSKGEAVQQVLEALLGYSGRTGQQAAAIRGLIANPAYLAPAQTGGQR